MEYFQSRVLTKLSIHFIDIFRSYFVIRKSDSSSVKYQSAELNEEQTEAFTQLMR